MHAFFLSRERSSRSVVWSVALGLMATMLFLSAQIHSVSAATCTFDHTADNEYNNATNYTDCGHVPLPGDDLIIPPGETVGSAATAVNVNSLLIGAGGVLGINGNALTVTASSTLNGGAVTSTSGTMNFGTTLDVLTGGEVVSFSAGGDITVGGVAASTGTIHCVSCNMSFGSLFWNAGVLSIGSGAATATGNLINMGTIYGDTGRLNVGADFANGGTFSATSTGVFSIYGTAVQNIAGATFNNVSSSKTGGTATFVGDTAINGALDITGDGGTISSATNTLVIGGETSILSGGTLTSTSGNTTHNAAVSSTGSISSASGNRLFTTTLQNNGTFSVGAGVATATLALTSPAGSTINVNAGKLDVDSAWTMDGTFNAGTGFVRFFGGADQVAPAVTFNNLDIRNTNATVTLSGDTTINGDLVITTSTVASAFNIQGRTVSVGGALTNSGVLYIGTGSLSVAGISVNNGVFRNSAGTATFADAVTNNSILYTVTGNILFSSSFANVSGGISVGAGTVTSTGNFTNSPGAQVDGSTGRLDIVSAFSINNADFVADAGTVRFFGVTDQVAPLVTYNDLEVRNSSATLTLSGDTTVGGTLIVASSSAALNAGTNALSVTGSSTNNGVVTSTSGVMTFGGTFNNNLNLGTVTGQLVFSGSVNNNSGSTIGMGNGLMSSAGTFVNSSGATILAGTDIASTFTITGDFANAGTYTPGTAIVVLGGTAAQNVSFNGASIAYLSVTKTGGTASLLSDLTVVNTANVAGAGGTLSSATNTLAITTSLTVGANATLESTSGPISAYSVLNNGTISTTNGNITITASLNNNPGATFSAPNNTAGVGLTVGGDLINADTGTFTHNNGTTTLSGASSANVYLGNSSFYDVAITKTDAITPPTLTFTTSTHVTRNVITSGNGNIELNSNNITIDGQLNVSALKTVSSTSGNISVGGNILNDGVVTSTTGVVTAVNVVNTGSFGTSAGTISLSGTFHQTGGNVHVGSDSFIVGKDMTVDGGSFYHESGTFYFNGPTAASSTGLVFGIVNFQKSATLTLTSSSTITGTLSTSNVGTIDVGANDLTVVGTSFISTDNSLLFSTGNLVFGDTVKLTGTLAGSSNGNILMAALTNSGTLSIGAGTVTSTGTLTNGLTGTINGNTGTLVLGGAWTNNGTFNRNTGTVRFAGAVDQVAPAAAYYALQVRNTSATLTFAGDASFSNSLTVDAGGVLNIGANTLTGAAVSNSGVVTSTTGVATFAGVFNNGGNLGTASGGYVFQTNFNNLGGGLFRIESGSSTVMGDFDNTAGATFRGGSPSGRLNLFGSLGNAGTFTADLGTVAFLGATDQTIAGVALNGVLVDKTTSIARFVGNADIGGSLSVNGNGAVLSAGTSTLGIGSAALIYYGATVTSTSGVINFYSTVSSTGSIGSVSGNVVFTGTFQNNGTLNIGSGVATTTGALTTASGSVINNGTGILDIVGAWTNGGTYNLDTGMVRFVGSVDQVAPAVAYYDLVVRNTSATLTAAGTVSVNNSLTVAAGSAFNLAGNYLNSTGLTNTVNGVVTSTSGNLTFTGSVTNDGWIGTDSGTISFGGVYSQSSGVLHAGQSALNVSRDFLVTGGSFYHDNGTTTFDGVLAANISGLVYNNLRVTKSASVVVSGSSTVLGILTTSGTGTLNADNVDFTVVGASTIGSGTTVTSTSGLLNFLGAVTSTGTIGASNGTMNFGSTLQNNGVLNLGIASVTSSGTLTNAGTIYGRGSLLTLTADFINSAAFNRGTSTVRLAGSAAQSITGVNFYNLASTKTGGSVATIVTTAPTVLGTLTLSGSNTLALGSLDMIVTGNTTIGSGTAVSSTSGDLTFYTSVTSTGTLGSTSGDQSIGTTFQNNGTFQVGSGSATTTGALTNAGTIQGGSGMLTVVDAWTNTGTFTRQTGTVRFAGSAAQTVPGVVFTNVSFRTTGGNASLSASTTAAGTTEVATSTTLAVGNYVFTPVGLITNNGTITEGASGSIVHANESFTFTSATGASVTLYTQGDAVYVTLQDSNRNLLGSTTETIPVVVTTGDPTTTGDSERITLQETAPNSGIFRSTTTLSLASAYSPSHNNGAITYRVSDSVTSNYTDSQDSSDVTTTTKAFTVTAATVPDTGGGGGGSGGGGSSTVVVRIPVTTPVVPPVVPVAPVVPAVPPVVPPPSGDGVLLGGDAPVEGRIIAGVFQDAREFRVTMTTSTASILARFVAFGTEATRRLGEGERRAVIRDALETLRRADISIADLDRMARGQIPLMRNLVAEREQLPRVRATFRTIFGHDPNFQNAQENLAWNTLMYRIRFVRDLTAERRGITEYRRIFSRTPSAPMSWAAVRLLGYVRR